MIFEEKYFSWYILSTDHVSLSGCLYFMRYWAICVLQMFVNQIVTSWILKLYFQSSRFSNMPKKSWQKLKYLENKSSLQDETKSIFRYFKGFSMKQITQLFLEGESRTLKYYEDQILLIELCHENNNTCDF